MAFERARIAVRTSVGVIAMLSLAAIASANQAKPLTNAGPVLEEFGKQARDQSLPEAERIQVINLLGLWATEDVRAPLVALLDDPLPSVRAAAARGLGWKGNQPAAPALKTRLTTPGEPIPVRVAVLEALGRIGDP